MDIVDSWTSAFDKVHVERKIKGRAKTSFLDFSVSGDNNDFSEYYFGQTLYENQRDIVNAIINTSTQEVDIVEPRQVGKCLAKGTPVLMYDGSIKPVENIQINDLLMGDDSTPRRILSLAHGYENMYRIVPRLKNYESYTVNESHILSVKNKDRDYRIINISVHDYLRSAKWNKSDNYRGYKVAVEFEAKPLPVDPYWFGLWLGDGISSSAGITNTDPEVKDYLAYYAQILGMKLSEYIGKKKCPRLSIITEGRIWSCEHNISNRRNPLIQFLKNYGLLDNKHIPHIFFANSRENRLKLLAGIIDTDGHKPKNENQENVCEISSSNYCLAQDIVKLCRSLGFRASLKHKYVKYSYKGIDSEKETYIIHIYGNLSQLPTRIKRKQYCNLAFLRENPLLYGFDIQEVGVGEYYGFTIDGNGLFVLGDFTVTHNTSSVAVAAAKLAETIGDRWNKVNPEPYRIGIFGPKLAQAQIDLQRIKFWASHNKDGKSLINWSKTTNSIIMWRNGVEIHAVSASEHTETEGLTYNVVIIEEAQKVSDHAVSQVISPMIGATGGKIVKIGTVRAIRNHFWRSCNKNPRTRKVAHHWLSCGLLLRRGGYKEYKGNMIPNYILDRMPWILKEKYMLSDFFPNIPEFMYYGDMEYTDFLTQYELEWLEQYGIFLSKDEIERMFLGYHPVEYSQVSANDELFAGIDFATGSGNDDTSVSVYKKIGNLKRKIFGCTWADLPIPDQKREIINLFGAGGRFHPKTILGDVGGNGQAVIEDIRAEYAIPIFGVHFGTTDRDIKTCSMNMKTSMFNDFKKELQNGLVQHFGIDANTPKEMQMTYHKDRREWESLEVETREDTVNKKIQATESEHDDICCSDVLALRAMKLSSKIMGSQQVLLHRIPYAIVPSNVFR